MADRLEGKVAVVTGGGNGIGKACCLRFAQEGAQVVVADVLDGPGAETVAELGGLGTKATFCHLDAANPTDNLTVMQTAVDTFGALDVLVTAAGISHAGYRSGDRDGDLQMLARAAESLQDPPRGLLELTLEEWQRVLDVNLTGTLLALQAAARHMVRLGRGGSII
ncbi:MAG: SDR family oxidoreductase, partial [Chloroflexi bacterium]